MYNVYANDDLNDGLYNIKELCCQIFSRMLWIQFEPYMIGSLSWVTFCQQAGH